MRAHYSDLATAAGVLDMARYADVVSPNKERVISSFTNSASGMVTSLVRDAHAAGLLVVPYTFRREKFLPARAFRQRLGPDPRR